MYEGEVTELTPEYTEAVVRRMRMTRGAIGSGNRCLRCLLEAGAYFAAGVAEARVALSEGSQRVEGYRYPKADAKRAVMIQSEHVICLHPQGGGFGKVVSHVVIGLKTAKGTKQVRGHVAAGEVGRGAELSKLTVSTGAWPSMRAACLRWRPPVVSHRSHGTETHGRCDERWRPRGQPRELCHSRQGAVWMPRVLRTSCYLASMCMCTVQPRGVPQMRARLLRCQIHSPERLGLPALTRPVRLIAQCTCAHGVLISCPPRPCTCLQLKLDPTIYDALQKEKVQVRRQGGAGLGASVPGCGVQRAGALPYRYASVTKAESCCLSQLLCATYAAQLNTGRNPRPPHHLEGPLHSAEGCNQLLALYPRRHARYTSLPPLCLRLSSLPRPVT